MSLQSLIRDQSNNNSTDQNNNNASGSRWYAQCAPTFAGKFEEDFQKWRNRVQIYFVFLGLKDARRLASLPMLLEGRAFNYFFEVPVEERDTYDKAMTCLECKFGAKSKGAFFHTSILNYNQGSSPVAEYSTKIIDKLTMLNINDEFQKMNIYLRGLNPELASTVIMSRPDNLSELENVSLLAESTLKLKKDSTIDELKAAVNSLANSMKDRSSDNASASVQAFTDNTNRSYRGRGHGISSRGSYGESQIPQGRGRGTYMHQQGQYGQNDWYSGQYNQPPQPRAPGYQQRANQQPPQYPPPQGHNNNFGQQQPGQYEDQDTRRCYGCGQEGHLQRTCPNRNQRGYGYQGNSGFQNPPGPSGNPGSYNQGPANYRRNNYDQN